MSTIIFARIVVLYIVDFSISFLSLYSEAKSGVYKIQAETKSNFTKVYCEMTSLGECTEGGWTLMMKINGSQVKNHALG
jgi:hypothetical protein